MFLLGKVQLEYSDKIWDETLIWDGLGVVNSNPQAIYRDMKSLGYLFQWCKLDAQDYLLPQRRNRIYGFGDLDEGQDYDSFAKNMYSTCQSMTSDRLFNFTDIFEQNLPSCVLHGNALENVQRAIDKHASESTNIFVDTSTSARFLECSVESTTCIRPSHPIFSVQLNRYLTVEELFRCQGIWPVDFENPEAFQRVLKHPAKAQDLCGNAFASTCAQAMLISSLVHGKGWKHVDSNNDGTMLGNPSMVSSSGGSSDVAASPMSSPLEETTPKKNTSPKTVGQTNINAYLKTTPSEERSAFCKAPAAKAFEVWFD